jgi:hypothetical protein
LIATDCVPHQVLGTLGLGRGAASLRGLPPSPHAHSLQRPKGAVLGAEGAVLGDEGPAPLPESFDAREEWPECAAIIGAVRNQGDCGSCWAFGAVEVLADRHCIHSKGAIAKHLSPQSLVNCDAHDNGCHGGFVDNAWRFLMARGAQVIAIECH